MNNIISILKNKRLNVLWILGFVIALSGFTNLNAQSKTWIGGTGNWDVPTNWSPAGVPTAANSVFMSVAYDLTIPPGYNAECKSIQMSSGVGGGKLRILNNATLSINGSTGRGLDLSGTFTEVINEGIFHIGNTANIASYGIYMLQGKITNTASGVITINRVNNLDGLAILSAAQFLNSGAVQIGNLIQIQRHGILLGSAGLLNNSVTGIIEVNRSQDRGLWISDVNTKLENSGILRFGNNAASNFGQGIYAFNDCRIFNYATGLIEMNRFVSQGILVSGPSTLFTNDGVVNVGNNVAAGWDGIYINGAGAFLNNPSGNISVNKMQYNGFFMTASSSFMNKGSFKIGNLGSVNWTCVIVEDKSVFTNESGAYLECNSANSYEGISIGHALSKFINNGLIKIGNLTNIGRHGILMTSGALFQNNSTAAIEINRCGSQCIYTTDNSTQLQNSGSIKIGNLAPSAINGIELQNQSVLQNNATASIEIDDITGYDGMAISNNASLYNYGQLKIGNIKALSWRCLSMNFGGKLFNYASGSIELNRCTNYNALEMYDAGTYFLNSGSLKIGNVAAANWSGLGLSHQSQMDITSTGTLEVNNTNFNDGAYIVSNAVLNNSGNIKIGNNIAIKLRGIFMASGGILNNLASGHIEINRVSSENGFEIRDVNTKLTNFGVIKIGNIAPINFTCIYMHSSGQCENKAGASMELNNTINYHGIGIAGVNTVFSNAGILKIGNTNKINFYGLAIENASTFNNLAGAVVEIDSVASYDGLVITGNSIFNNSGHLKVGNNNSMGWRCLNMGSGGKLNNLSTGVIELNRTKNNWHAIELYNTGTKLINQGLIKIGNVAPILLSCIAMSSQSQFENSSIGVLEMNNTVNGHGIHTRDLNTKFDNSGIVKMGFNRKIHDIGILMESGSKFNNFVNATIEIDSIKNRDGIRCTGASTVFENAGTIKIGKTYAIAVHGITLSSAACVFNNQATGIMEVNRCINGLNILGAANFNNSGSIKIGNLAALQSDGIRLAGSGLSAFTNQINGVVEIDNVANLFAVDLGSGTIVSNYGTIKIGFNSPVFHGIGTSFGSAGNFNNYGFLEFKNILNNGIHSNQTLHNNPGATLSVPAAGKLQIANLGVLNNAAGAFVNNFGTLTNNGIINNSGTFGNQNIYKGTGVFNTSLFNNPVAGTVAPGLSPGCLQFTNGWASVGKLEIEINGPVVCSDYDQIQVSGNALVGGNLYINFNYTPACGATFQLINATTHSGSFANIFITPNTIAATYSYGILTILDVNAPSITCPSDVVYTTIPGDCGPVPSSEINLGSPVTSDNCGVAGTSNNAPSAYALGVKNVKWTVTDLSGNTNTCIQKVTIKAGSCGTPQQVYQTDITQTSAKIKWNAGVPCATDYQLRIRYEISPGIWSSWSGWNNHSGPGLEHLFSGLSPNRYYHYQIRSKCGSATNSNSINAWFTTLPSGGSLQKNDDPTSRIYKDQEQHENISQGSVGDPTSLFVSPNPAREILFLHISGFHLAEKQMTLMDVHGKLILNAQLQTTENEIEIDLHKLNVTSGIYFIRISNGTKQITKQVVVEK